MLIAHEAPLSIMSDVDRYTTDVLNSEFLFFIYRVY